jgi:hypothetical protein
MGFIEKLVDWVVSWSQPPVPNKAKETPPGPEIILPSEAQQLLNAIDNQELQDLSDKVYLLAINLNGLLQAQKQQQELLIHIATLHEELLNQLDQGNVVMIRRGPASSSQEENSDPQDIQGKKKHILN